MKVNLALNIYLNEVECFYNNKIECSKLVVELNLRLLLLLLLLLKSERNKEEQSIQ